MSSFTTPPLQTPTADPGATQTSSSDNNGGGGGGISGSSSLYLYTFLATLVLLLTVSGTIVLRSMHIRRRQRAAILAAIANGTYVPPTDGNGRGGLGALLLGEKPKMYEVALVDEKWVEDDKLERQEDEESEEGDGLKKEKALGLWGDITPFSAQFLTSPTSTDKSSPTAGMTASQLSAHRELMGDAPATTGTVSFSSIVGYWRPRRRVETVPLPASAPVNGSTTTTATTNASDTESGVGVQEDGHGKKDGTTPVQVAVLISMPSPLHPHSRGSSIAGHERTMSGDSVASGKRAIKGTTGGMGSIGGKDEEDIPVVEIGVVSVRVREGP